MKTGYLDWTDNKLNVFVFEQQARQNRLIDSSSIALEKELDPDTIKSLPLKGCSNIYLSVPLNMLTLREQTFPFADKDKIRDTIPFELEGMLLGDTGSYSIDHIIIESYDVGSRVLAVCMEKSALKTVINMFSSADFEPKLVTSIDLRLSGRKGDKLLEETVSDFDARAEAASQEISNPSINLRQDDLSYMGDVVKFVGKLRATAVLVLILVSVLAVNASFKLVAARKEHQMLTKNVQDLYRRVFPEDKKIIDPARQFKGNLNMLAKKNAALAGIPVLDVMRDIAEQNNKKITLHEFSADGKNYIVKGTAQSFEDVESVKNSLTSIFKEVKVTDSGATADKDIKFTIVMKGKTA